MFDRERDAQQAKRIKSRGPYHSASSKVYHTYEHCVVGNNIEDKNVLSGTGNKGLCSFCRNKDKQRDLAKAIVKRIGGR